MPSSRRRTRATRVLVIDASVVQAAGGEQTTHQRGKLCRDFLRDALSICHRATMTPELGEEWKTHRSPFARKWLCSMFAHKKVVGIPGESNESLRDDIARAINTAKKREAAEKDMHLIEAALATEQVIISLDEKARDLFSAASRRVRPLRKITWANPEKQEENVAKWLRAGAGSEEDRMLGFR